MIGLLEKIACILRNVLLAIAYGGAEVINLLVKALGLFGAALIAVLPGMPDAPEPPDEGVLNWLSWIYPLPALLAVFATALTTLGVLLLMRTALRWVKAL